MVLPSFVSGRVLTDLQLDRAAGVLLGAACGDALGVPYEFCGPLPDSVEPRMAGGGLGPYEPGEYSDDTQMAVCIAEVTASGADVRTPAELDRVAERFVGWFREGASDVGAQTRQVLGATARGGSAAQSMRAHSSALHRSTRRTAGNGSLMRTGVLALAYLDDVEALADAARTISELTHHDDLAGDACVLWCAGIRKAVLYGRFDGVREGLWLLPGKRRGCWSRWLTEAERRPPRAFSPNGFVVSALQAAWSAITRTPVPAHDPANGTFACQHLTHALTAAVRAGNDTDTVAAITGALLGARWGSSAVPLDWQRIIHGWPGCRAADLIRLAVLTAQRGQADHTGWPTAERLQIPRDARTTAVPHPVDGGVLLGSLHHANSATPPVDAVVSLCRTGTTDKTRSADTDRIQVWLVDVPGHNQHPHFVVDQAARAVASLRAEGKRVLLHSAAGRNRMPAVAARFATLRAGSSASESLTAIHNALDGCQINQELHDAVYDLADQAQPSPPRLSHPPHGDPDQQGR